MNYIHKLKKYAAAFLLLCLTGCSQKIIYQSSWQHTPVVADGIANEWKIPLRFYDPDTKLNYTVSNDKENLYLCIRAADEGTQVKIMRAGMQVWIDTMGKNKKQTGILYPMPNTTATNGSDKNKESGFHHANSGKPGDVPSVGSVHQAFLAQATEMQLTGFKAPIGGLAALVGNNNGIKIGMNWDSSDILIYEAVIPFKTFCSSFDSAKTFSVGVTLNAVSGGGNTEHGGGGGGGMGGGGGGGGMGSGAGMGGGGGMHGGGGHRGGGERNDANSDLYSAQNFWVSFHLAAK